MKQYSYKIRLFLLAAFGITYCNYAKGQASSADPITFPRIIPPSPDAQTFIRYGDFPVDYCTGIPKIDIPLYEIKCGDFSLPVSISYHAGGIRVTDIPGVVGLGWKLNAGGLLTRTVKGRADETNNGILNQGYLTKAQIDNASKTTAIYYRLEDQSKGNLDTESDSYFYSVSNGLSGNFVYVNNKIITPLTFSTDKFIKHTTSNTRMPYYLEVVKDDGSRYIFDQPELTIDEGEYFPSSWWLSKIVLANKSDSILFEYVSGAEYADFSFSQSARYGINKADTGWEGVTPRISLVGNTTPLFLKKIRFSNGYIQFDYANDRIDMRTSRLTSIGIYNSTSLVKKYQFDHSYFNSGNVSNKTNYRLKLNKLTMYDGNNSSVTNYTFNYFEDNILPPYILPGYTNPNSCFAVDYWGFYNGETQNPHMIPNFPMSDAIDRSPDITYAKSCTLNKIIYPTGGYTTFEFESNVKYDGDLAGGLRVSSIISKPDNNSPCIIKRYEYSNNLLEREAQMDAEGMFRYDQEIITVSSSPACNYWLNHSTIYMSNPIMPLVNHNGVPAIYQYVNEYLDDGQNNKLKTTYFYAAPPDIVYSVSSPRFQDQYYIDRSWRRGLLEGTTYYKLVNGSYKPIKSISYNYGDYKTNTIISGTKVQQKITNPGTSGCFSDSYYLGESFSNLFYYFDETIEIGSKKMTQQQTSEYDDNGNITLTAVKDFSYNSIYHLFPTSITYVDSKNDNKIAQYKYPTDFTTGVYSAMTTRNMLNYPIEETTSVNNNVTSSKLTTYKINGSGYVPDKVYSLETATPLASSSFAAFNGTTKDTHYGQTPEYSFDSYDTSNGNPLKVLGKNGIYTYYVWAYNKTYPIAKIESSVNTTVSITVDDTQLKKTTVYADIQSDVTYLKGLLNSYLTNKDYQVTIFTYKPLVGMTSQTDPAGRTTYYEYDDFGRLKLTKDLAGNILKKYEYHYAGQN